MDGTTRDARRQGLFSFVGTSPANVGSGGICWDLCTTSSTSTGLTVGECLPLKLRPQMVSDGWPVAAPPAPLQHPLGAAIYPCYQLEMDEPITAETAYREQARVGAVVKNLRELAGLTRVRLGAAVGLGPAAVRSVERGYGAPSWALARVLAHPGMGRFGEMMRGRGVGGQPRTR